MLRVAGYVPVIPISVANNYNLQKFLKKAVVLHDNFTREISTGDLTNFLRRIIQEKPLYSKKGEFKIFYATQTGIKPPEFQIFVNHPELVPPSYLRFLKNAIREEFGYEGIPLKVLIKSRRKRSPK
jgi:GTP-binding protein